MAKKPKMDDGVFDPKTTEAIATAFPAAEPADPFAGGEPSGVAVAVAELPTQLFGNVISPDLADHGKVVPIQQPADPQPNGTQPIPQPARTPARKKRDPDAPRPLYYLMAQDRRSGKWRILATRATVGQARKALADAMQTIDRDEDGPYIVRGKLVA